MEYKKDITGEWARKTAEAVLGEKVQVEITKCINAIEVAEKENKMSIGLGMYVDKLTLTELTKRGFKVKQQDDQRDGAYLMISW